MKISEGNINALVELKKADQCGVICDYTEICGLRHDGIGYKIRLFENNCELTKYNCNNDLPFTITDLFVCKAEFNNTVGEENQTYKQSSEGNKEGIKESLVVVNSKMFGHYDNINDSIDTLFDASHVFDLPLKEVPLNTRRKLLKYAGPVQVFVPWISKPENISNDTFCRPTLSSCYHKCPFKCPDTYAPVCGVPGVVAREPFLMFQNHCFMDVAQCKMFWENKSSTSHSSSYVESSFLFCMGDEINAVYRFMPAIRTLQHMGRLKKKGKFRAILKNFRFVSEFRYGRPKFMGRK
ncbi:uncharacterized protein LOC120636816 [Pararge aegeria]|uniref:uncharacterized protein LOC120636816 n=1 Tax=Pararge aegeria TaxID=116150 RepID=UPI0019D10329|nr:uncharacterized protein LOC120636816 [Pararge aegeria]